MRYLIVLDAKSPVGRLYAKAKPPFKKTGEGHPVLECIDVDLSNHWYILANHSLAQAGGKRQSLFLPHGSVVQIVRYDETEELPMGFPVPASDRS